MGACLPFGIAAHSARPRPVFALFMQCAGFHAFMDKGDMTLYGSHGSGGVGIADGFPDGAVLFTHVRTSWRVTGRCSSSS